MTLIGAATVEDWPQVAVVELGRDVSPSPVHNPSLEIRFGGGLALSESHTLVRMSLETANRRERTHSFYEGAGWTDNGTWW